jgi:hypothetical protein
MDQFRPESTEENLDRMGSIVFCIVHGISYYLLTAFIYIFLSGPQTTSIEDIVGAAIMALSLIIFTLMMTVYPLVFAIAISILHYRVLRRIIFGLLLL